MSWSDLFSWFSAFATQYGDRASVLGTVLTLFGFVLTLWQVIRTRKAAEQARQLAKAALDRVTSGLLVGQVSDGLRLATDLAEACRSEQWGRAIDRCGQLRILVASIAESPALRLEESNSITATLDDLKSILRRLEEKEKGEKSSPLSIKMRNALDDLAAFLGRLDGRLKGAALEIPHDK
ncbi:MAG: hypothetical protein AB7G75_15875 [Candidatus Binatia bacterium]